MAASGTALFLIDERYDKRNIQEKLSSWILAKLRVYDNLPQLEEELKYFFEKCDVDANSLDNALPESAKSDPPGDSSRGIENMGE